mgnify:CR=1 FL=1
MPNAGWGSPPPGDTGARGISSLATRSSTAATRCAGRSEVRGARAGRHARRPDSDEVRVGTWGVTNAGGWSTPLNERLRLADGDTHARLAARPRCGVPAATSSAARARPTPFLGVIGMPPPEPGVHWTGPPRRWGGNIDCSELVAGDDALPADSSRRRAALCRVTATRGRATARCSQLAIDRGSDRARSADGLARRTTRCSSDPIARIDGAWITFGFDEDLDEAAAQAVDGMLALMDRELGLARRRAALASVAVDLRVTQLVNGASGRPRRAARRRDSVQ